MYNDEDYRYCFNIKFYYLFFFRFNRIVRYATKNIIAIIKVKIIVNTTRIKLNLKIPARPKRIKVKSNINAIVANTNILFKSKLLSVIWFHFVLLYHTYTKEPNSNKHNFSISKFSSMCPYFVTP